MKWKEYFSQGNQVSTSTEKLYSQRNSIAQAVCLPSKRKSWQNWEHTGRTCCRKL